jgi:hypothetical protein
MRKYRTEPDTTVSNRSVLKASEERGIKVRYNETWHKQFENLTKTNLWYLRHCPPDNVGPSGVEVCISVLVKQNPISNKAR